MISYGTWAAALRGQDIALDEYNRRFNRPYWRIGYEGRALVVVLGHLCFARIGYLYDVDAIGLAIGFNRVDIEERDPVTGRLWSVFYWAPLGRCGRLQPVVHRRKHARLP